MKHLILMLSILACYASANAQLSVTASPTSVQLWGKLPNMATATLEYQTVELMALIPLKRYEHVMPNTLEYKGKQNTFNLGLFWKPLVIHYKKLYVKGGPGAFFQKFPTPYGSIVNFTLEIEYKINDLISVQYQHISNGMGLQNSFNPGLDNFSIKITFN